MTRVENYSHFGILQLLLCFPPLFFPQNNVKFIKFRNRIIKRITKIHQRMYHRILEVKVEKKEELKPHSIPITNIVVEKENLQTKHYTTTDNMR